MEEKLLYHHHLSRLIVAKFAGVISEEENRELNEWRERLPENEQLYQQWCKGENIRAAVDKLNMVSFEDEKREMKNLLVRRIEKKQALVQVKVKRRSPVPAIAAAVILLAGILGVYYILFPPAQTPLSPGITITKIERPVPEFQFSSGEIIRIVPDSLYVHNHMLQISKGEGNAINYHIDPKAFPSNATPEEEYTTLVVPPGAEYDIVLPDGTRVWMNADSKLTFPVVFGHEVREVELSGEAYFQVVRNTERPFRVKTGSEITEVLGTEFNVHAYGGDQIHYITLVNGKVKVYTDMVERLLHPGEQAVVSSGTLTVREIDVENETGWRNGMFVLENKTLDEILASLSRWYDFEVIYQNDRVKQVKYAGYIHRYESFEKILNILEWTKEVRFMVEGKRIIVNEYKN